MEQNFRTRKLVVNISQAAYKSLQKEAVRLDRHTAGVASDICESALLALQYNSDDALDELPDMGADG